MCLGVRNDISFVMLRSRSELTARCRYWRTQRRHAPHHYITRHLVLGYLCSYLRHSSLEGTYDITHCYERSGLLQSDHLACDR
jgi:hypothetical protein